MSHLMAGLLALPPLVALALVFLCPALEASAFVGVVVPGEIAVILGGVLANYHRLPLPAVLAAAVAGAVIGDSVGYRVGLRHGEWLLARIPDRVLPQRHVRQATGLVRRFGGRAVFAGRWTAALRALMPGMCGLSRVPYRTFLLWNVIGGLTWATLFVLLGYLAGSQYRRFERYANGLGLAAIAVVVLVLVIRWWRGRQRASGPGPARRP